MFSQAKATIGPERDELLDKASEMIEKDMILLGQLLLKTSYRKGSVLSLSLPACANICVFVHSSFSLH